MERRVKNRKLTPAEAQRYRDLRKLVEKDKPAIAERAKAYEAVVALVTDLKAARDAAGLSLADIRDRTGIDRGALSRLENGIRENPSIETLVRYAGAVGCRLVLAPAK